MSRRVKIRTENLVPVPHNLHYEEPMTANEKQWRLLCAEDKADNILLSLESAGVAPGSLRTILEVGAGSGAVLDALAKRLPLADAVGVDVVATNTSTPDGHPIFRYDGRRASFDDSAFDLVYATHVLEHVEDERAFVRELLRIGARLVYIEVPCEASIFRKMRQRRLSNSIGHINRYSVDTLEILLNSLNCKVVGIALSDHSLAVLRHTRRGARLALTSLVRRSALSINPRLASVLFTYHASVLIELN